MTVLFYILGIPVAIIYIIAIVLFIIYIVEVYRDRR